MNYNCGVFWFLNLIYLLVESVWNSPWNHVWVFVYLSVSRYVWCVLDSFTVPLHSANGRHLPAVRAVQGDGQWPLKNGANSHRSHEIKFHCNWGNPSLYLKQPITKRWYQPIGGQVSYPTDIPYATRLGLCISLAVSVFLPINVLIPGGGDPVGVGFYERWGQQGWPPAQSWHGW